VTHAFQKTATASLLLLALATWPTGGTPVRPAPGPPRVSANGRYLLTAAGKPLFLVCDTAWQLALNLERDSVAYYLDRRKAQRFNAITLQAFPSSVRPNRVGDHAFAVVNDKYDPLHPLTTPGHNPANPIEYDHWDNLDYVLDLAGEKGFYVLLLPTWGSMITGGRKGTDTTRIVFNPTNAYRYGHWLGTRYKNRTHLIWMLGGDQSAVYPARDFRPVVRAMAEGIADGINGEDRPDGRADYRTTLMSYHPEKLALQSSAWFHHDDWLDFNSIQEWPEKQLPNVVNDHGLRPTKPTWLFEGRYENYYKNYDPEQWRDWQMRFQAYQTVFAGGFGHTYGHEYVFGFRGNWAHELNDPGAQVMQHLATLMQTLSPDEYLSRIPDQDLLDGDPGKADRLRSTRQQATRGASGRYALIYSANGRRIRVKMAQFRGPLNAYWFNPRNGAWHTNGQDSPRPVPFARQLAASDVHEFDPPGEEADENDWVLVLRR
jgi:hypothetical protein